MLNRDASVKQTPTAIVKVAAAHLKFDPRSNINWRE